MHPAESPVLRCTLRDTYALGGPHLVSILPYTSIEVFTSIEVLFTGVRFTMFDTFVDKTDNTVV